MKVKVLVDHLEHDGKRVERGAILEVIQSQAEDLIAIGAVAAVEEEAKRGKKVE
jgi:hypothetical protein